MTLCASTESNCCAHVSGNEVSGAFYSLAILQPDSLLLRTEAQLLWAEFPIRVHLFGGFISTAAGIKVTSRHLVVRLMQLKTPHKRACKSAGRTAFMSALLHLISFSPSTCWMSSFLSSEN